jgi:hypothetical protein
MHVALWARRILGAKNSLTEVDARRVEGAFWPSWLEGTGDGSDQPSSPVLSAPQPSSPASQRPKWLAVTAAADRNKNRLARPEPRRFRDKKHVKFVAK